MLIRTVEPKVQGYNKLKNSPKPPGNELFRHGIRLVALPVRILRKKRFFEIRGSKNVFFGQKSTFSKYFGKKFLHHRFKLFTTRILSSGGDI